MQWLVFTISMAFPVRGNMISFVNRAIEKAGSWENIRVWFYPTPQQQVLLRSPKLILLGPWGCGKTVFLIDEACKTAVANPDDEILFAIFAHFETKKKTMLSYHLENVFEGFEKIKVQTIFFENGKDNR